MDSLIDLGDRLVPVEVKSGATVAADTVDALRWWTGLAGNRNKRGVLVHGGDHTLFVHWFTVLPGPSAETPGTPRPRNPAPLAGWTFA